MKNKIDKFRNLDCIYCENRNPVVYGDNSETTLIQKVTVYQYFP